MQYVLETDALTKEYRNFTALKGLSMHIPQGAIYGFVGRNGAGKTTLIRLICGLQEPSSGSYTLYGASNSDSTIGKSRRRMGAVVESPSIYMDMTARDNIKEQYQVLGLPSEHGIDELLQLVGLADTGKKKAKNFSLGMRQRLGIAIALLGNPEVLILDEPINGLDPAGIKEIRDIIIELNRRGVTFLISSHLLDELGKIATNYGIVSGGVLVEEITAEALAAKCRTSLKLTTDNAKGSLAVLKRDFAGLTAEQDGQTVRITSPVSDPSEVNAALVKAGIRVYEMANESMGFEDFFIERLGR